MARGNLLSVRPTNKKLETPIAITNREEELHE
jgi:hypothetical protein